jgi:hypothetical protein
METGVELQPIWDRLERALEWYAQKQSTHKAAILGIGFGLLLCAITLGICGVLMFVAQLGGAG